MPADLAYYLVGVSYGKNYSGRIIESHARALELSYLCWQGLALFSFFLFFLEARGLGGQFFAVALALLIQEREFRTS